MEVSGKVAFEQRPESLEELAVQLSGEEGAAVQRPWDGPCLLHLGAARRPAWLSRRSEGEHGGGGVSEGGRGWTERESCFIPGMVGASGGWQC